MARVPIKIGEHSWNVGCRAGEEEQLLKLAAMVEARWDEAKRAAGDAGLPKIMLMAALMLADDLADAQAAAEAGAARGEDAALDEVAERLEAIAAALEHRVATS
jgi:cell division protein ZapA